MMIPLFLTHGMGPLIVFESDLEKNKTSTIYNKILNDLEMFDDNNRQL